MIYVISSSSASKAPHGLYSVKQTCEAVADIVKTLEDSVTIIKGIRKQAVTNFVLPGDFAIFLSAFVGKTCKTSQIIRYYGANENDQTCVKSSMAAFIFKEHLPLYRLESYSNGVHENLFSQKSPCVELVLGNLNCHGDVVRIRDDALHIARGVREYVRDHQIYS